MSNQECPLLDIRVVDAIKRLRDVHSSWSSAPDSSDIPPTKLWEIIEELEQIDQEGSPSFLPDGLSQAVQRLIRQKQEFDANDTSYPQAAFYTAVSGVFFELDTFERVLRTPIVTESMQMLVKSGVPHDQIAQIYGLMKNGVPQRQEVERELRNPGSVILDSWCHPREVERSVREREYDLALERFYAGIGTEEEVQPDTKREPCRETWVELFQQGVSADQAASMKCVSLAEAQKEFDNLAALAGTMNESTSIDFTLPVDRQVTALMQIEPESVTDALKNLRGDALRKMCTEMGIAFTDEERPARLIIKIQRAVAAKQAEVQPS